MVAMTRARNTGSFDRNTKTWRLRGKGIHVTVRQLERRYGVTFRAETPAQLERESASLWARYRQDIEDGDRQAQKAVSPFPDRIRSLEAMIDRLKGEGRPQAILERLEGQLRALLTEPYWSTNYTNTPAHHPDIVDRARRMEFCTDDDDVDDDVDDALCVMLEATEPARPTTKTTKTGMVHEADIYIDRHKAKGHKGWYDIRTAVTLLTNITGDIPPDQVTVHHYRQVRQKIISNPDWGATTKANVAAIIRGFLRRVEADHNLTCYGFLNNRDYLIKRPKGKKEQYTLDQVKTALKHATGDVRFALLIGLNTGGYMGDVASMTPDMIHDGYLIRSRDKQDHLDEPVVGCWLLWEETKRLLRFGLKNKNISARYSQFAKKHGLPSHKALRKTTSQLMHEAGHREASRLFKCRDVDGVDGGYYISDRTEPQVKTLDTALRHIATVYGIS